MKELFSNPVTLIAIGLAAFFVAMAIGKRWNYRRAVSARNGGEKPYQVSDPYVPPPEGASAPQEEPPSIIAPPPKVFRQFGSEHETSADKDYVWE